MELFLSAYLGLLPHSAIDSSLPHTPINTPLIPSDKLLHFVTFAVLALTFYWILDTSRRRCLNFTLVAVTCVLGVGSEVVQGLLPNERIFDVYDIVANVIGSVGAVAICTTYHKRMLERRRRRRMGSLSGGADVGLLDEDDIGHEEDLELGEPGDAIFESEDGTEHTVATTDSGSGSAFAPVEPHQPPVAPAFTSLQHRSLDDEVDNWDENAADNWDEADEEDIGTSRKNTNGVDGNMSKVAKLKD